MSIASEITRINGNIAAAYTALDGKGATLPETQNSANLADTIDTITTGGESGGGKMIWMDFGDFNESEFDAALSTLKTEIGENYKDNTTKASLYSYLDDSNSWTSTLYNTSTPSTSDWLYFGVLSFSSYINKIKIKKGNCFYLKYFKVPSTAQVSATSTEQVIEFTGNERYIMFATTQICGNYTFPLADCLQVYAGGTSDSWYTEMTIRGLGYIKHSATVETVNYSNDFWGKSYGDVRCLVKCIFPSSIKLSIASQIPTSSSSTSIGEIFRVFSRLLSENEIAEYFYELSSDSFYGVSSDAVPYVYKWCGSSTSSVKDSITDSLITYGYKRCPIIIDMSATTSTSTWNLYKTSTSDARYYSLTEVRLKLPSSCSVNLCTTSNCESYPLSLASYQYIATNAPNCSKTLKVGYQVEALMAVNSSWAAVKTTLESKGWTVSA